MNHPYKKDKEIISQKPFKTNRFKKKKIEKQLIFNLSLLK